MDRLKKNYVLKDKDPNLSSNNPFKHDDVEVLEEKVEVKIKREVSVEKKPKITSSKVIHVSSEIFQGKKLLNCNNLDKTPEFKNEVLCSVPTSRESKPINFQKSKSSKDCSRSYGAFYSKDDKNTSSESRVTRVDKLVEESVAIKEEKYQSNLDNLNELENTNLLLFDNLCIKEDSASKNEGEENKFKKKKRASSVNSMNSLSSSVDVENNAAAKLTEPQIIPKEEIRKEKCFLPKEESQEFEGKEFGVGQESVNKESKSTKIIINDDSINQEKCLSSISQRNAEDEIKECQDKLLKLLQSTPNICSNISFLKVTLENFEKMYLQNVEVTNMKLYSYSNQKQSSDLPKIATESEQVFKFKKKKQLS